MFASFLTGSHKRHDLIYTGLHRQFSKEIENWLKKIEKRKRKRIVGRQAGRRVGRQEGRKEGRGQRKKEKK